MAFLLSIETATPTCSVALHQEGKLLANQSWHIDKSHSSLLAPAIDNLMKCCGVSSDDLSAIAVSSGPGSYTGLRIGVSTAKGLCYGNDIPLIAVNTLQAMAYGVARINTSPLAILVPMIDARRMEVYCLASSSGLDELEETHPKIIDETAFHNYLEAGQVLFFGDGAAKCKTMITHPNAIFLEEVVPDAINIGDLGWQKYLKKDFESVAYYEPFYLKDFKATKPKVKY